ncbi:MAG TPA: response regulator [Candidatus Omnitrophota bacterium]|nr:response regulator [Candidatus Omnitrophota bacterium]
MKTILLCEDSKVLSELLYETLKAHGYQVLTADNGYDALAKARNDHPDLILLDLMLPKIDGLKICRMLKFDEKYKKIPIIIFTAKAEESDQALGFQVGADAYIPKTIGPEKLLEKLKEFLGESA